jgi:putative SOS response-associated peptidase YedK
MCFHNSMSAKAIKVAARYGRQSDVVEIYQSILDEQYHVNAFTFPRYPIITSSDEVQVFNWGLIPFWVRSEEDATEIRKMTLNARADTIFEKPSFREPIMKKRCIVPSTGYFEWRHEGANKIPYYIYVKDEPIFSMAGIYDRWLDKDTGEEHETFSIITTDTNSLTDYIDNTKPRHTHPRGRREMAQSLIEQSRNSFFTETLRYREDGCIRYQKRFLKEISQ